MKGHWWKTLSLLWFTIIPQQYKKVLLQCPHPVMARGYNHPVMAGREVPPSILDGGTSHWPDGGTPCWPDGPTPPISWMEVSLHQPDGGTTPPPPSTGWGNIPISQMRGTAPSAGWEYPPSSAGWMAPPPPLRNVNRHLWKQYLPHSFGMRAVNITMINWTCGSVEGITLRPV